MGREAGGKKRKRAVADILAPEKKKGRDTGKRNVNLTGVFALLKRRTGVCEEWKEGRE